MEIRRRELLTGAAGAPLIKSGETVTRATDFARANRRHDWLHHAVVGDPSWDTFEREPGNPIYVGRAPYVWPVNGFLFRDPPSNRWYAYVSLYPRGYWPPPALNSMLLREKRGGGWEELGPVFRPDPSAYNGDGITSGGMTDVSVVYDGGRYHLLFGWCDPQNKHGGLGYAWASSPEGPFTCADRPIHDEAGRPQVMGRYARAYASTLFKRKKDWLILHMMSTPGNAGGVWALFCMTASEPGGPYSDPKPLLYPQSDLFHPPLAEFYPALLHDGFLYAPATSVAANRSFQTLFRAPLETAHRPESWRIVEYGSVWHEEPGASEARGIWGQTFSGQVAPDGSLRVLYPSKNTQDAGAIHIARRPWNRPVRDGFTLSAPNAPAFAILRRICGDFTLSADVSSNGPFAVSWGCRGPLGPNHSQADSRPHALMHHSRAEWRRGADRWSVVTIDEKGVGTELAVGRLSHLPGPLERLTITRRANAVRIELDSVELWTGAVTATPGRLEIAAHEGSIVRVRSFQVSGRSETGYESWLSTEGLAGAASAPDEWSPATEARFRFGAGHVSRRAGARAKWNVEARGIRLWSPRGPGCGAVTLRLDGRRQQTIDLETGSAVESAPVAEVRLAPGRHAVVLAAAGAGAPCDCLEILP